MNTRSERQAKLEQLLSTRILCLDGAMGTAIQGKNLGPADFGGDQYEGCNENLVLTRPDVIKDIHKSYLLAGADILETNTFGSTSLVLAEYDLADRAYEITLAAARLAREAADELSTPEKPRFVAGSMGPTTKAITVTGGVTFEELRRTFKEQARALIEGGADYLLLETCQDTRNIKAGLVGILDLYEELGYRVPVAVSGTIEPMGTMLAGQNAESLVVSLSHLDLLYVGLNCATGPELMTDHIRAISELAKTRVACVPNAGLPDENGTYLETPAMVAQAVGRFVDEGWVNLVGGCCGTGAAHIAALSKRVESARPRRIPTFRKTLVSGLETVEVNEDNRPVLVGERTNSLGSKLFKQLIAEEKYEEASEIARRQVKNGAQVIDVCLQNPDRDERRDTEKFLDFVIRKVKVPLMIDTTDASVLESALTYSQGKAIINSINLEDGLERYERVVPLAKRFGAALVVGCIDENKQQGMAVSRERKLAIAKRSHEILTRDFGVDPGDIIFDPLVFPCATGDQNYIGSATETVEGIRLIKEAFPECKTILGISNVSFGLPATGREVLNAVFLYHCTKAGLDMAIVNSEKLERYASIPEDERKLAEDVLFRTTDAAIAAFTAKFREQKSRVQKEVSKLSLDERLASYIITGSKDGLVEDLELKRKEATPLEIINGPLMAGMDEVGRLFNNNELIVAEVLQSAEAMKAAVAHLEQFMEKDTASQRGTVLLATVKGDVHDIGKNLVEIILSNNGYKVVNLGIKIPPHELISAIDQHKPDIVGLSGLLVKSALQMVVTAEELSLAKKCPPMLVGGAALTRNFTNKRIAPAYQGLCAYAKDAMDGLDLANRLMSREGRAELERALAEERQKLAEKEPKAARVEAGEAPQGPAVRVLEHIPAAPDHERHVMKTLPIDEVWSYVNPKMLYGKHLGLKGNPVDLLAQGDSRAVELKELIDRLKAESRAGGKAPFTMGPQAAPNPAPPSSAPMAARAVWQFFPASSAGDVLRLHAPRDFDRIVAEFALPRQDKGERLCLADYVRPADSLLAGRDSVCLFVVTAGEGIRARYEALKAEGRYLESHAIQALAIETAEAAAEWLHKKLRGQWGFPDLPDVSAMDLFQAHYRGKRYSFGYPACPDLAMQKTLFELIRPEEIGVTLTEEHMMEPEASVSALVFHHPDAKYFSVGKEHL
jgi:5-methyltetrahydrofolate--homocysteine methyltransferase